MSMEDIHHSTADTATVRELVIGQPCCSANLITKVSSCSVNSIDNHICSTAKAPDSSNQLEHRRSSSNGEATHVKLSVKNDSFLSIGTGSDLFQEDHHSVIEARKDNGHHRTEVGEDRYQPDDVESGRFTEQESMDLTNEFGNNDDEEHDDERDSESDVIEHLRTELEKAKKELRMKNEKCEKLSEMQSIVDSEIHELTASLFQEAYKMVSDANQKRHTAEKLYKEASGKVDVLEAEVEALKALVLTSTPSTPNKHLHPQLLAAAKKPPLGFFTARNSSNSTFSGHKRNHSDTGSLSSNSSVNSLAVINAQDLSNSGLKTEQREMQEVDPTYFREFTCWREKMDPNEKTHPFLRRIYCEEITLCMNFPNRELATLILSAIEKNMVVIERIAEEKPVARICSLLQMPCTCNYRLKLDSSDDWIFISTLCRNRIATVCDFLTYLRYMQQGLVKCGIRECYWEIIRLRKNMTLARLGLGFVH